MFMMIFLINKHIFKYREDFLYLFNRFIKPYLNIKFLISYGIAWIYHIPIYLSVFSHYQVIRNIGWGLIAFLYNPICNENIWLTIPVALFINKKLFKGDKKVEELVENVANKS